MNQRDDAKLAYEQLLAGMEHGTKIATLAIDQFPDGFTDEVGIEIGKIIDAAVATVIKNLKSNGVKRKFREPFENGFYIAVRNTIANYADDCRARALRGAA